MTDFGLFPGILGHVPGWRALDRSVRQVCRLTGYTQDLTITLALTILIAAWAIVSGGVLFWAARDFDREHGRWWLALGGLASLIFGVLLILAPMVGAIVLTLWLGAYAVVFGVLMLVAAYKLATHRSDGVVEAEDMGA